MKEKLAIIGTGVAGLGAAHFLHSKFDITMFEKNGYVGGHSNTVDIIENGNTIPIDTGFIVFNKITYPNLLEFFENLHVPYKKSNMSFSVQHVPDNLEFCGSGLNGLFCQRRNLLRPRFYRLLLQINRFNQTATEILDREKYSEYTLGEYLEEFGYHRDLLDHYLIPMSSAVWSTPPDKMLEFPAVTLIRFFYNHGFMGLNTQHQWYTVDGGSREYIRRVIEPFREKIHVNAGISKVSTKGDKVEITTDSGDTLLYDKVILATHGDTALKLLENPSDKQRNLLSEFHYQTNWATLHTDESSMPKIPSAWSAWNYRIHDANETPSTIYWMNRLQGLPVQKNYFVSINEPGLIKEESIIRKIKYEHPLFSVGARIAQRELPSLNETGPLYFCGSYFRYGFHEDAFSSGKSLAQQILAAGVNA